MAELLQDAFLWGPPPESVGDRSRGGGQVGPFSPQLPGPSRRLEDVQQEDGKEGRFEDKSDQVIGACIEVHRHLGPGLLESTCEHCLAHELRLRGFAVEQQRVLPVFYKGVHFGQGYRLDIVVDDWLVIEVKAVERLLAVHEAQALTYLKLAGLPVVLLVNFHVEVLKRGLRRLTNRSTNIQSFPSSRLPV